MTKKFFWSLIMFFGFSVFSSSVCLAADLTMIKAEDLSLNAGPTQGGEELSLAWLESFVYPKTAAADRLISLGLRTVSRLRSVTASFDFNKETVVLSSDDGLNWSGSYQIPNSVSAGLHLARFAIAGQTGAIQRTVEFTLAENSGSTIPAESSGQAESLQGWMLTVVATAPAVSEDKIRTLQPGQGVFGLYKLPWYRVVLEDGKEGWVSSLVVKEPLEDFYQSGREAYHKNDLSGALKWFTNAVAIDKDFAQGYLWLAKTYRRLGNIDSACGAILTAIKIDNREIEAKVVANTLAQEIFASAVEKNKEERFNESVALLQKVVQLKPSSTNSWIALGRAYDKLGFLSEARNAWRMALKDQPDNQELHALLKIDAQAAVSLASQPVEQKESPKAAAAVPAMAADDSLAIIKKVKTKKGTRVDVALRSVVTLTKSLGTPVEEKGWQVSHQGKQFLAKFIVEQGAGALEAFEWLVDVDTRKALANNDNARVLMSRW